MEHRMSLKMKKIKDPRLIPRMREYLESRANKNFVSIPLMAEYLQDKYPEYGRKKKRMFIQYVDKAYSYMEKPSFNDPPPPLSDTDENSNTEKELVEQNGHYVWKNVSEHSREPDIEGVGDKVTVNNDSFSSSDEEDIISAVESGQLVEYKDTNVINNRLMNLYRNSPTHVSNSVADDKKRKAPESSHNTNVKKSKSESKVLYPSPNVMERNISSTGLVGPRRSANDKYFIDRKGDNATRDKSDSKESREVTIQKFLGDLPSRTSFSAYVSGKADPRMKGGTLYRVFSSRKESEHQASLSHSGITSDNVGVTNSAPKSPTASDLEKESYIIKDPRINRDTDTAGNSEMSGTETPIVSRGSGKEKISKSQKTKKGKKSGTKVKRQDDSDSESTGKDKGLSVQKSSVTFADVGGNEKNLIDICKLLVHMRHPEVYQQLGVTPPRGFLLHGPPGCGKTLLANAIAGELDLALIKLAATEIVSGVSGNSEEKIRDLFDKAAESAPCVVFIDEIDAITPKRETASKDMERRIVAQLLACMDELNDNPLCHVLVIGATNRPDSIDPALRRAGRFDREICLGIPDEQSRLRILEVLCRNLRLSAEFDFNFMAHNTPGYVGADLMALTREAAMTAVNRVFQDLQCDVDNRNNDNTVIPQDSDSSTYVKQDTYTVVTEPGTSTDLTPSSYSSQPGTSLDNNVSISSSVIEQTVANVHLTLPNVILEQTGSSGEKPGSANSESENVTQMASIPDINISGGNCNGITEENGDDESVNEETRDLNRLKDDSRTIGDNAGVDSEIIIVSNSLNNNKADKALLSDINVTMATSESKMEVDNEQAEDVGKIGETKMESARNKAVVKSTVSNEYTLVLSWLKEHPPLTEEQLTGLFITMDDFKEALRYVQPSAKREGFATIPDVTWDDIGALHEVREELTLAILAPVRHPEHFKSLGLTRAQGILLAGPPGCGKTLLAKAVANESGINFISVKGPELLNMYVGESERAVRTVFQRARNSSPCVIFFDELDALCPRRSGHSEGNSSARVVNQLLTEMDGLEERKQVFIMAATNRPDIIDPAVLRPGRLDKTLYVGLPTASDRLDILKCITKNSTKPCLSDDVNLTSIAEDIRCDCYTGADLAALVREASISALKEAILDKERQPNDVIVVNRGHFDCAFMKVKPSVTLKDQEKYDSMRNKLAIGS
ncbi:nuclear valosin-containing protein-like isoform X2 [Ruditapes philippinarum]|nr:nuclear valosin-containing protein-like isoform X2 [Ruditapes philippinarum]